MFHSSKPYSAVTVQIEVLTSEQYEVDDSSGIVDLIEAVNIQSSGPFEASRALRKKLKYGNLHRQLRALTILDYLIQNAGARFLREFADEMLLERLRIAATDPVSDPLVKQKCKALFGQWASSYNNTPGMERVAGLYRQLPKRKQPASQAKAKVLRESGNSRGPPMGHSVAVSSGSGPPTVLSHPKDKQASKARKREKKIRGERSFNLEREKPEMLQTLASSSVASTNLLNALKHVDRETHRVSEDAEATHRFDTCKQLRRQILRYIQHVESEEYLGSLIHANEELVSALMSFEVLDKSVDYDSDSDQDVLESLASGRAYYNDDDDDDDDDDLNNNFAGLMVNPPKPPRPQRPVSMPMPVASSSKRDPKAYASATESEPEDDEDEDEDEDNPFGDRNAIRTPAIEKSEPTWREV
ncbi:VHS domain protein [Aspergillus sp. HF37]|nr:VHS domain protein [Aspergillus sp. HF37]